MVRNAVGQVLWVMGALLAGACQGNDEDKGSGGTSSVSDGAGGHGGGTGSGGSSGGGGGMGGHGSGTSSGGSLGGGGGTGGVTCGAGISPCGQVDDCPVPSNACLLSTCQAGCCGTHWVDAGTPIATQTPGDCQEVRCDGAGKVKAYPDDNDVPVSSTACLSVACKDGVLSSTPVAASCNEGGGKVCGEVNGSKAGTCVACNKGEDCSSGICASNTCVPVSCTDQVKSEAETDVDCGGGSCPPCGMDQGCLGNFDCTSGACIDGQCARCLPGAGQCSNQEPQVCNAHGNWKTLPACDDTTPTCCQGQCTLGVADIEAGVDHTCARTTDNTLWCWGDNGYGQLGNGSSTPSSTPVMVASLGTTVTQVAVGYRHTCALREDSSVWCWGNNSAGQLGDGTAITRLAPTPVTSLGNSVKQVMVGMNHTCALKLDATVWCWGDNIGGQLGDGTETKRILPVQVIMGANTLTQASAIAAGFNHTCALKLDGTVWCWGSNSHGQLGDGSAGNTRLQPVLVTGLGAPGSSSLPVTQIAAGGNQTWALVGHTPYGWGDNTNGQLGQGTPGGTLTSAAAIASLTDGATAVAAGSDSTCARKLNGTVWCWGNNAYGQLGDGTFTPSSNPVPVAWAPSATSLSVGRWYACGTRHDGSAWCWGVNFSGNLGDGPTSLSTRPLPVRLTLGVCASDLCINGVKDPGESDIDCGGSCLANGLVCTKAKACSAAEDCATHVCTNTMCACAPANAPCGTFSDCCSQSCSASTHRCS